MDRRMPLTPTLLPARGKRGVDPRRVTVRGGKRISFRRTRGSGNPGDPTARAVALDPPLSRGRRIVVPVHLGISGRALKQPALGVGALTRGGAEGPQLRRCAGCAGSPPGRASASVMIWIFGTLLERRFEKAGGSGLPLHRAGRQRQRDQHADRRLLALDDGDQVAHHADPDILAALDRDQRLLGLILVTAEKKNAVDAAIGALFLAAVGPGIDQATPPTIETDTCRGGRGRSRFLDPSACRAPRMLTPGNASFSRRSISEIARCVMSIPIHARPQLLCGVDRGAAAAERVEDEIPFVR